MDGQVTGDVQGTEKVVVTKTGRVQGNITAPRVTLEDGAKFRGSIDMDPGESQPASAQTASVSTRSGSAVGAQPDADAAKQEAG